MTRIIFAALLLAGTALAGCGKLGTLEQPAPLYGAQAKADYAAKQRAAADARARAKAQNDQPDTPDRDANNSPPLTQAPYSPQISGAPSGPNGPPPQGVLPNPGENPDQ